jgi:hypothetical protein
MMFGQRNRRQYQDSLKDKGNVRLMKGEKIIQVIVCVDK